MNLKFTTGKIRWLVYGLVLFITPLLWLATRDNDFYLVFIFLAVFGPPIFLIYIYCAKIEINDSYLLAKYPFGSYKIKWDEINGYAIGYGNLKFYNTQKSLTLPSTELWLGKHKNDAIVFVSNIIDQRGYKQGHTGKSLIPTFFSSKIA